MLAANRGAPTGRKRILVVEDDLDILKGLSAVLSEEGYEVDEAIDGEQALSRLATPPRPDLIILDLMMPVMDGWEFRTRQRADPTLGTIPVLVISADGTSKAKAIDAACFLKKPFRASDLLGTIEKILTDQALRAMRVRLGEAERLASLGTLAAGAAHEISNPLAVAMANLETMEAQVAKSHALLRRVADRRVAGSGGEPDGDVREIQLALGDVDELLRDGRMGLERVSRVVRNLQTLARRGEERAGPVDLVRVIDNAVALASHQLRHRARLIRDVVPVSGVIGDEFRLGQLLINLLVNAAQAIPEGNAQGNEVRLSLRAEEQQAVIEVTDSGHGIEPEVRARLFEPFFTTKPPGVGTGLGLSICQSVILEHGGAIEVDSTPGRGSTFRVRLPLGELQPAERSADEGAAAPVRRGRVLVVDDEPHLAWAIKRLLDLDHDVVAVTHGREALDRLSAGERFDVVVCDASMPYLSGPELYGEIARAHGNLADRILFVTGGSMSEDTERFFATVANPRLMKPFDAQALRRAVRALAKVGADAASG